MRKVVIALALLVGACCIEPPPEWNLYHCKVVWRCWPGAPLYSKEIDTCQESLADAKEKGRRVGYAILRTCSSNGPAPGFVASDCGLSLPLDSAGCLPDELVPNDQGR